MMIKDICTIIRSQVMFYMDNELKEDKRLELGSHLELCEDCKRFYCNETEVKDRICQQLKEKYHLESDIDELKNSIQDRISEITTTPRKDHEV